MNIYKIPLINKHFIIFCCTNLSSFNFIFATINNSMVMNSVSAKFNSIRFNILSNAHRTLRVPWSVLLTNPIHSFAVLILLFKSMTIRNQNQKTSVAHCIFNFQLRFCEEKRKTIITIVLCCDKSFVYINQNYFDYLKCLETQSLIFIYIYLFVDNYIIISINVTIILNVFLKIQFLAQFDFKQSPSAFNYGPPLLLIVFRFLVLFLKKGKFGLHSIIFYVEYSISYPSKIFE